jgi:glucose/arabinose dehydrogenase
MKLSARFLALAVVVPASLRITASSAEHTGSGMSASAIQAVRVAFAAAAPPLVLDPLASNLGSVTAITNAGDGRVFLTLQAGRIVIWDGTRVLDTPFLDVSGSISSGGERGLLSTAFHPQYAQNGFFFVYYTDPNGDPTLARYHVSADPNVSDASSGVTLLTISHPGQANHNGGQLQFGPDGFLYMGVGDGGSANDPPCNAQRSDVLLGKLLRLDVDPQIPNPPFYAIPAGNPFVGHGGPDQGWAKGLRNPWRFSFDRATGDLYVGDVGQGDREEIDFQPAGDPGGENYGWKVMEGTACGGGGTESCPAGTPPCNDPIYVRPVLEYTHADGNCTVIGGYVYRGGSIPDLYGQYLYGDFCTGTIWSASHPAGGAWTSQVLPITLANLSTFGQDASGELYAADTDGTFLRIRSTAAYAPALDAVSPAASLERGGTIVTLTGANFLSTSQVTFGGVAAASTTLVDPGTLVAIAPPHTAGTVDVTVTNPGAAPATLTGAFTYEALTRVQRQVTPRVVTRP